MPTEVKAEGGELRNVVYPPGEKLAAGFAHGEMLDCYSGRVEITGEVGVTDRLSVTYQACDDARCLPPVRREVA